MSILRKRALTMVGLFFLLQFSQVSAMESEVSVDAQPQEIQVIGHRQFRALRREAEDAEDIMYGLFNELNEGDRYDIHCYQERRTGTKIPQRVCRPNFLREATRNDALNFLSSVGGSSYSRAGAPVASVYANEMPKLEENLKALVQESPEFLEAVLKHHELREELENHRRNFFED